MNTASAVRMWARGETIWDRPEGHEDGPAPEHSVELHFINQARKSLHLPTMREYLAALDLHEEHEIEAIIHRLDGEPVDYQEWEEIAQAFSAHLQESGEHLP